MSESPFTVDKIKWIFAACCVITTALHIYLLHGYFHDWEIAFIDGVVSNALLAAACILISNNLRYYRPQKDGFANLAVWCLFLTGIWIFSSRWLLNFFITSPKYGSFFENSIPIRCCFGFLIIGWMAMVSTLWYTNKDQRESEQRKTDTEKLAREAELNQLRQHLQPHFLFNSLNSIIALISIQPEQARKMIHQLADFLRGTLKKDDQQQVSLAEELEHLALYLDIEKVRFGHRLFTSVDSDAACSQLLLPSMLLQPLVENAIKFGLYDTISSVSIVITARCIKQDLLISVKNPFDAKTAQPLPGTGFGLSGVKRRLYLLFSRNDLLETRIVDNHFITTVKIPQT
ncbi:MAG: sensor histidine kinase [Sphingobacteriaceae bacterium]